MESACRQPRSRRGLFPCQCPCLGKPVASRLRLSLRQSREPRVPRGRSCPRPLGQVWSEVFSCLMVRYDISVGSAEPFGDSTSQCKFTQTFRKEPSWRREIQAKSLRMAHEKLLMCETNLHRCGLSLHQNFKLIYNGEV